MLSFVCMIIEMMQAEKCNSRYGAVVYSIDDNPRFPSLDDRKSAVCAGTG